MPQIPNPPSHPRSPKKAAGVDPERLVSEAKLSLFYRRSNMIIYSLAFLGFFAGMKACDYIFYDPLQNEILREKLEEDFWDKHGEPKHLKPELVESVQRPGTVRKSWIQIVLGKDAYVSKPDQ